MDISHPLASLLPAADAGALAVLAGTQSPLTGRRVAELARRDSHASTIRALDRLVRQGLVHVQAAGNAKLYQLNRDHVLAPAVLSVATASSTLQAKITAALTGWPLQCLHASLYGSVARGEAGAGSDIDILVVRPGDLAAHDQDTWTQQLADLETSVQSWTGNHLSWLETTPEDLARAAAAGEPIFESWRDDSILLVGVPLAMVLRRAGHGAVSR